MNPQPQPSAPLVGRATPASLPLQVGALVFWSAGAVIVALNQGPIIFATLRACFGDPSAAPEAVLRNLTLVSPAFPSALGVVALAFVALRKGSLRDFLGFRRATLGRDFAIGLACGLIALAVALVSLKILSRYFDLPPLDRFPGYFHLYFATVGAVLPGVFEEVYFRGLLFRVAPGLHPRLLLVLSATVFALWHIGTPVYLAHTFLMGLIFGTIFVRTGRLAPCIIAHVAANAGFGVLLLAGLSI